MAKKYRVALGYEAGRTYKGLSKAQKTKVNAVLDHISAYPGVGTAKNGAYTYATSDVMIQYVINRGELFISVITIIAL